MVKTGASSRLYFLGQSPGKDYYLLVEGQWHAPDLRVIAAFKLYGDLLAGVSRNEPLEALRALASRFGVPVQIGKHTDTFIASMSFELQSKEDRLLKIATGQSGQHLAQTMHSSFRHEGGKTFLDVSLAYCLDIDKMAEYVKAH